LHEEKDDALPLWHHAGMRAAGGFETTLEMSCKASAPKPQRRSIWQRVRVFIF